jgi:hypothetical protein
VPTSDSARYNLIESELGRHHIGNRTRSTALLAWFLETVWRLDPEDVTDSICDGGGDKGIDALDVDEDQREIVVFQAKHRTGPRQTQGDADLRNLMGVATYFRDEAGIDSLLASSPNAELRNLVARLSLREKLAGREYSVRLVFVKPDLPETRHHVETKHVAVRGERRRPKRRLDSGQPPLDEPRQRGRAGVDVLADP